MDKRLELLAAVRAAVPLSAEWTRAVQALGTAAKAGFPPARKPGRPTGKSLGELYQQLLRSHVFEYDRDAWQKRWRAAPASATFDTLQTELAARKAAEKINHAIR